jgi:hypothetical protein
MLQMNAADKGSGEMAPASKVKWMESGAPAVEDYGKQVVWLDDVTRIDHHSFSGRPAYGGRDLSTIHTGDHHEFP